MVFEQIKYEVDEGVGTITLNRPEKLNAFTGIMREELLKAFDMVDEDDHVSVLIVTGAGRGFCAGADLSGGGGSAFNPGEGSIDDFRDGGGMVALRIFNMKKPVIAAINGPAVGVGATLTLPMDIRIASEKARMGFVFTRRAIAPDGCCTFFLTRIVGTGMASEWIFTGRVFSAQEALGGGLVNRVVPHDQLLSTAREIAREIAENTSSISVALSRQMLGYGLGASHPMESHRFESKSVYFMGQSADCKEGVNAFLEKRPPRFAMKPSKELPNFYPLSAKKEFKDK